MDMEVLGKKLDTYRDKRGRIVHVSDELRLEVLSAWEQWKGKLLNISINTTNWF